MINPKITAYALALLLCQGIGFVQAQEVEALQILPEKPQANDTVFIRLNQAESIFPNTVQELYVNFSTSNYYELPSKMRMTKNGSFWEAKFKMPPYGNFSSFTIADAQNNYIQRPSDTSHYEIFVYEKGVLKEGNYLGKGYSMGLQNKKAPNVEALQQHYFEKELAQFPNNYEARLRVLNYQMKQAQNGRSKEIARKKALQVIEKRFRSNPTVDGNLNKVTMGFLIIGENQKVDSIRNVVIKEFPYSKLGLSYTFNKLFQNQDKQLVMDSIQVLSRHKNESNSEAFSAVDAYLFTHYIQTKNTPQAAQLFSRILEKKANPYTWRTYSDYVRLMLDHDVLLDSAKVLNQLILDNIQQYPVSLVRYFPETGYLVAHDDLRQEKIDKVKLEQLAVSGLIDYKTGNKEAAWKVFDAVIDGLTTKDLLTEIAALYSAHDKWSEATKALRIAYTIAPYDEVVQAALRSSLMKQGKTTAEVQDYIVALDQEWKSVYFKNLDSKVLKKDFLSDITIVDMNNKPLTRKDLAGKVVVMDLWATWCKPCLASFPYVQKVYEKYKNDPQVLFIILNTGSGNTLADAQKWATENQRYTFPVFYNQDKKFNSKLEVTTIPTTFVLSPSGQIIFKKVGSEGEKILQDLDAMIDYTKRKF